MKRTKRLGAAMIALASGIVVWYWTLTTPEKRFQRLNFNEKGWRIRPDTPRDFSQTVTKKDGTEIPREEANKILDRYLCPLEGGFAANNEKCSAYQRELFNKLDIGDVTADPVGRGIIISTDQPEKAPKEIEGIRVFTVPKGKIQLIGLTTTQPSSPV